MGLNCAWLALVLATPNLMAVPGPLNEQGLLLTPASVAGSKARLYVLPATPATTQWGVFNQDQPPVLKIHSGDSVAIETAANSNNQEVPGVSIEEIIRLNDEVPGRGPHTLTGPIYVEGAEPGDVLKIHLNKIVPRAYGSNYNLPGKGLLADKFPKGQVKNFYLDIQKMQTQFAPGVVVPLAPFPGTIGVAQAKRGKIDSIAPGNFGGNMDLAVLTAGNILYLPVLVKGALLWTGDSHAKQGSGEINLTAIETAFAEFNITVELIKHKALAWPLVETPDSWVTVGYDHDLNKALSINIAETILFIQKQYKITHREAEKTAYAIWNCHVAEVVDQVNGTYCVIPKKIKSVKLIPLVNADNAAFYVTSAKNTDLMQAMKDASWAMINKIVKNKSLSPLDAYSLCSIALECRISPYQSGAKEVYCLLAKKLWVD